MELFSDPKKHVKYLKKWPDHIHMFGDCMALNAEEAHLAMFQDDCDIDCEICSKCRCCGKIH